MIKRFFEKEPVRRAIRTFFQAAAGYVAVNVATTEFTSKSVLFGFIASTIAAGIAAVMNIKG